MSDPKKFRFVAVSRATAESFIGDRPYVCISIGDPGQKFPAFLPDPLRVEILRLEVSDFDIPAPEYPDARIFSPNDAKAVLDFANKYIPEPGAFLIHCEAGVSRSRGVALALALIYDCVIPEEHLQKGFPNALVVYQILEEHYRRTSERIAMPDFTFKASFCATCPEDNQRFRASFDFDPLTQECITISTCMTCETPAQSRPYHHFEEWQIKHLPLLTNSLSR
jgi:predicted protein tyrosine phosphatase